MTMHSSLTLQLKSMLNHIFQKEYFEGILQHYMKSNPIEGKKKKSLQVNGAET
jgi:hypothetical protein